MNTLGHRIDTRSIQKNSEEYPDCLAWMSGEPIGIEVTELVDREAIREHGKLRESPSVGTHWLGFPNSPVPIGDLENFYIRLDEIVRKKDMRVRDSSLVSQFLLIVTDEPWLDEKTVSGYIKELKLKRPRHFDRIYLMLSYDPGSAGEGRHPVFEIPLGA